MYNLEPVDIPKSSKMVALPIYYTKVNKSVKNEAAPEDELDQNQINVLRDIGALPDPSLEDLPEGEIGTVEEMIEYLIFNPKQYRVNIRRDFEEPGKTHVYFCDEFARVMVQLVSPLSINEVMAIMYSDE